MIDTSTCEIVYFVRRSDVALGYYPHSEPVVLIDAALAHRYVGLRELEVIDAPDRPENAPPVSEALPVFAVDQREAAIYEAARPATMVRDLRRHGIWDELAVASAPTVAAAQ